MTLSPLWSPNMPKAQSAISLLSLRWSLALVIGVRDKENVSDILWLLNGISKLTSNQVSPITLGVQSPLSGPISIPIVCSQGSQKLYSLSPKTMSPIPLKASAALQVASLCPRMQGSYNWEVHCPPLVNDATLALVDLHTLLKSQNPAIHLDNVLWTRLDHLDWFLAIYIAGKGWIEAANYTATTLGQGTGCSWWLHVWGKNFVHDWSLLPCHNYMNSGCSSLLDNVDFWGATWSHR